MLVLSNVMRHSLALAIHRNKDGLDCFLNTCKFCAHIMMTGLILVGQKRARNNTTRFVAAIKLLETKKKKIVFENIMKRKKISKNN